ncbi:uncharacterized protein [Clytia hemisphaerica]|uniref:Protein translocase subunit SecA n=1 Tax=Clytia hemisphaerica TaxID=252671 RepID=A0A7M5WHW5_9CNID|eukprot:TCONS_00065324-protein
MEVDVNASNFMKDILPYLDELDDVIVTDVNGERILYPCCPPKKTEYGWYCKERTTTDDIGRRKKSGTGENVVYFVDANERINLVRNTLERFALVLPMGGSHYISVIVHHFTNTIYILHSHQSHNENVKERALNHLVNVDEYDIRDIVFRQKEDTRISICYAYVRAKLALQSSINISLLPGMCEDIDILKEKNLYKMASLVFMIHNKNDPQEQMEENKEMIEEFITRSVNDTKLHLDEVLSKIEKYFDSNVLTNSEKNFIREEYTTSVLEMFLRHLQQGIESVNVNSIKKWRRKSFGVNKQMMITFQDVKGIQLIKHCWSGKIFSKKNEADLLTRLSLICELHLSKFITSLQQDCQRFLLKFQNFLKEQYDYKLGEMYEVQINSRGLREGCLYSWLSNNAQSTLEIDEMDFVKSMDAAEGTETSEWFIQQMYHHIHLFNTQIKCDLTERHLSIVKEYIGISEVVTAIQSFDGQYDELVVVSSCYLVVDANLVLPGINLIILADEIKVQDYDASKSSFRFDLSGADGVDKWDGKKAKEGKDYGDDGSAGGNGENGQSGGNVYIKTNSLVNGESLRIISNGGNGSNGQDGGDGKNGRQGEDGSGLTKACFEREFPSIARYAGYKSGNARREIDKRLKQTTTKHSTFRGLNFHTEGKIEIDENDHEIIVCLYFWLPNRYSYLMVKGNPGTKGTSGGDGGQCGLQGSGGYAGKIDISWPNKKKKGWPKEEATRGGDGTAGKDGRGGKGGRNGIHGPDNLRIEMTSKQDIIYYHGNLLIKYSTNATNESVYCCYHEKYASCEIHETPTHSYESDGIKGKIKRREKQQQVRRNAPVDKEQMAQLHQEIIKERNEEMDFFDQSFDSSFVGEWNVNVVHQEDKNILANFQSDAAFTNLHPGKNKLQKIKSTTRKNSSKGTAKDVTEQINEFMKLSVDKYPSIPVVIKTVVDSQNNSTSSIEFVTYLEQIFECAEFLECTDNFLRDFFVNVKGNVFNIDNNDVIECFNFINHFKEEDQESFFNVKEEESRFSVRPIFSKKDETTRNKDVLHQRGLLYHLDDILETLFQREKLITIRQTREKLDKMIIKWLKRWMKESKKHDKLIDKKIRNSYCQLLSRMMDTNMDDVDDCDLDVQQQQVLFEFNEVLDETDEMYKVLTNTKLAGFFERFHRDQEKERSENDGDTVDDVEFQEPREVAENSNHSDRTIEQSDQYSDEGIETSNDLAIFKQIEQLCMDLEKVNGVTSTLATYIQQLQFLKINQCDVLILLKALLYRLKNGELVGNQETIKWFILFTFDYVDVYDINDILLLVYAHPVKAWAREILTLQLQNRLDMSLLEEFQFKCNTLRPITNQPAMIWVNQRLQDQGEDEKVTCEDIDTILKLCEDIEIDQELKHRMQNNTLSTWPNHLQWLAMVKHLEKLNVVWKNDSQELNALYHLTELRNTYGHQLPDMMINLLSTFSNIGCYALLRMLQNFVNGYWILDKDVFEEKSTSFHQWMDFLTDKFDTFKDKERSLDDLTELIKNDTNTSMNKDYLDIAKRNVLEWDQLDLQVSNQPRMQQASMKPVLGKRFNKSGDLKTGLHAMSEAFLELSFNKQYRRSSYSNKTPDIKRLAEINMAVKEIYDFELRYTQKLAVMLFLISEKHHKGMLQQLSTGEGKSIIIAVLSIYYALSGQNVDIITSSPVLAKRDAKENERLYSLFNISVGHNCDESLEQRKNVYAKKQVIYGEIGAFQRDILLDEFYDQEVGVGSRKNGIVIVDEVDSMLLDKGQNVLYLSHNIPGLENLEDLYVSIWNFVHAECVIGSEEDIQQIMECIRSSMNERILVKNVEKIVGKDCVEEIWNLLIRRNVIKEDGSIIDVDQLKSGHLEDNKIQIVSELTKEQKVMLIKQMKDVVRRGTDLYIPSYLKDFVDLHLHDWVSNAFSARFMAQNDHYIIDVDRSEGKNTFHDNNIIIIDKDTGMEQYNSQWSQGLHQFLQLKHCCRISFESLKAVFMSNVSFFRKYNDKIFGLTGTLGSEVDRDLLKEIYSVEYATIPSFKPSKFKEYPSMAFTNEDQWLDSIERSMLEKKLQQRPVLIICDSVKYADKISKHLLKKTPELEVYKHSYENFKSNETEITACKIMVATNLAGRGTDLKIGQNMSNKGGLHVIISYMPKNLRVEQQAFGRAARKGQNGSGEIICLSEQCDQVDGESDISCILRAIDMKIDRQEEEGVRVSSIKRKYENVTQHEEKHFEKFTKAYRGLKRHLNTTKTIENEEKTIVLQSCLDNWAFWLDEIVSKGSNQDEKSLGQAIKYAKIDQFLRPMQNRTASYEHLIKNPAGRIKLAQHLLSKKKYDDAECILNNLIERDRHFSEIALYYKCYGDICKNGREEWVKVKENLKEVLRMVEEKIERISSNSAIITAISKVYQNQKFTFLKCEGYKEQKQQVIQVFNTMITSIIDILGHEATAMKFSTELSIEFPQALKLFQLLKNNDILSSAVIKQLPHGQYKKLLQEKYALYYKDIENFISTKLYPSKFDLLACFNANCRGYVPFDVRDLKQVLPSSEEFWDVMSDANIISNIKEYALVEPSQLKEKDGGWVEIPRDVRSRMELEHQRLFQEPKQSKNVIFMHENLKEQMSDGSLLMVPVDVFYDEKFDFVDRKELLEQAGIKITRTAILMEDCYLNRMKKYDNLHHSSFTIINGFTRQMSNEVFEDLVQNQVVERHTGDLLVPTIDRSIVKLTKHIEYEAEVMGVLEKNFQYRLALNTIKSGGRVLLEDSPHLLLEGDLESFGIIEKCKVHPSTDFESIIKNHYKVDLTSEAKDYATDSLLYALNVPKNEELKKIKQKKKQLTHSLISCIDGWKASVDKLEDIDGGLIEITSMFPEDVKYQMKNDLSVILNSGFTHTIKLGERKRTFWFKARIAAIILLALVQIVVAIVIEVCSAGAMTFVASGFMSEGVSDLMFAIEAAATGYCTWKAYKMHKIFSVAVTVVSCGLGAYWAKGAKCNKYGFKLSGEYYKHLSGEALLKEFTNQKILKAAGCRIGKKVLEAIALSLTNVAIDRLVKDAVMSATKNVINTCISDVEKEVDGNKRLKNVVNALCKKVGPERAGQIIEQTNSMMKEEEQNGIHQLIIKFATIAASGVARGFGQAAKKLSISGGSNAKAIGQISTIIGKVMKHAGTAKSLLAIKNQASNYIEKLGSKIEERLQYELETASPELKEQQIKDFQFRTCKQIKAELTNEINQILWHELLRPAIQSTAHNAVHSFGKFIQNQYQNYQEGLLQKDLETIVQQNKKRKLREGIIEEESESAYNKEEIDQMIKILEKTRSPQMYEVLIKAGVPMGVHCAQATADLLNRQIVVEMSNGSPPLVLNPKDGGGGGPPINLNLNMNGDDSVGHYQVQGSTNVSEGGDYNCFLRAAEEASGQKISRDDIANHIVNDPRICQYIEMGIHEHFLTRGKFGGVSRTNEQDMEEMVEKLRDTHPYNFDKEYNKHKQKFLDKAKYQHEGKKGKKSGNDEIWQRKKIREAHQKVWERNNPQNDSNKRVKLNNRDTQTFDELDIALWLRVDTQSVIFDPSKLSKNEDDPKIGGHTGALFKNNNTDNTGGLTNGQSNFHEQRHSKMTDPDGRASDHDLTPPQQCAVRGLEAHLNLTLSSDALLNKTDFGGHSKVITTTGHDLVDPKDRQQWVNNGYRDERAKIFLVGQSLNGGRDLNIQDKALIDYANDLNASPYIKNVRNQLKKISDKHNENFASRKAFQSASRILMKPAPNRHKEHRRTKDK